MNDSVKITKWVLLRTQRQTIRLKVGETCETLCKFDSNMQILAIIIIVIIFFAIVSTKTWLSALYINCLPNFKLLLSLPPSSLFTWPQMAALVSEKWMQKSASQKKKGKGNEWEFKEDLLSWMDLWWCHEQNQLVCINYRNFIE